MTRNIQSTGSAPCFASASLRNSLRIQLVGNNFCVRESIGSIEPTVFTGFFLVFIMGLLPLENFCTKFWKMVSAGARSQHPLLIE
jgi:hypothetical protein